MIQFLECIKNDGLPECFKIGDIFECEEYDETSYKVTFERNGKKMKARINKDYFSIPKSDKDSEEEIENPLEFIISNLVQKDLIFQVCMAYFNNMSQILSPLILETDADLDILNELVARRMVEASVAIEILGASLGIRPEDVEAYRNDFIKNMVKSLKNDKILI